MSLPALAVTADTRSITERVNVLIRDYNTMLRVPAGCVMPFAGATAPSGWLLCYGQAVSRTAYSDLFAAIGTTYGAGDGSMTFNVPDLRGRIAAGKDDMGGTAANRITNAGSGIAGTTLSATGGEEAHTLTIAEMPSHDHALNYAAAPIGPAPGFLQGNTYAGTIANTFEQHTGGGSAHNNTQPTIVLNHIIST